MAWARLRGMGRPGPPRFLACARFPGFVPNAAQAYDTHAEGQAERPIWYLRGNFWPRVRTVVDDRAWNRPGAHGVATGADERIHATPRPPAGGQQTHRRWRRGAPATRTPTGNSGTGKWAQTAWGRRTATPGGCRRPTSASPSPW